eukprot:scaffold79182_cov51-Prasinocladus_malaysianus.AAC.6
MQQQIFNNWRAAHLQQIVQSFQKSTLGTEVVEGLCTELLHLLQLLIQEVGRASVSVSAVAAAKGQKQSASVLPLACQGRGRQRRAQISAPDGHLGRLGAPRAWS